MLVCLCACARVCVWEKEMERSLYWLKIEYAPCRMYQSYSRDSVLAVVELLCTCYMSSMVWSMENKAASLTTDTEFPLSHNCSDRADTWIPIVTQIHLLPRATLCPLSCEGLLHSCILCLVVLSFFVCVSELIPWNFYCGRVCPLIVIKSTCFASLSYISYVFHGEIIDWKN